MNDPVYQRLREISWRRKLTPAEEAELKAWLKAHPDSVAECELDFALSDVLVRLPDSPVPSNFTALVLQGIERGEPATRARGWPRFWRVLIPRVSVAALILGGGVIGYQHYRTTQRVGAVSDSLVTIVPSLPSPQDLVDYDVIRKLDSEPMADQELLALLK